MSSPTVACPYCRRRVTDEEAEACVPSTCPGNAEARDRARVRRVLLALLIAVLGFLLVVELTRPAGTSQDDFSEADSEIQRNRGGR